jgi:FkbM family methyltransferase
MLISVPELKNIWGVRPSGVLHVGAHEGEESAAYHAAGWAPVLWVEALPDKAGELAERLSRMPDQRVLSAVAWDVDGVSLTMRRTNNGQSSSVLPLGTHRTEHPDVCVVEEMAVESSRLDTLLSGGEYEFDFVNLDVQGAELRALRGLGERIHDVKWIYSEVNEGPLYVGVNLITEIDEYLSGLGFVRVDVQMTSHGWGDALYVHQKVMPRLPRFRRALRRLRTRIGQSRMISRLLR